MTKWKLVKIGNYKLGIHEQKALQEIVDKHTENGIMSQKRTGWESPVFLKRKPNGKWRLLVNYREVNKQIKRDTNRMPNIDMIWPKLRNKKYFTTLDLNSGYFQIPLAENSRDVTGITVNGMGYVFNVLPQGMNVSPANWS